MMSFTVGAVIAATAAGGFAPVAPATDSLSAIQDRAQQAIEVRQDSLDLVADRLDLNPALTDAHHKELASIVDSTSAGLDSLGGEIAGATTSREAATEFAKVFTEYHVYAVVVPQAAYVGATDRLTERAIPALEKAYATLEPLAAKDPEAAADVADMRAALDKATALTNGLADQLLAVTPADYNDDPTVIAELRITLQQASVQLRSAMNDARDAVEALR
jgi:hypothetical protein